MCPIAAGNWNNGVNAGPWAANWNNARGNSNDNVGFRADSATPRTPQGDGGAEGDAFLPWAKSSCRLLPGSASERQRRRTLHSQGARMKRHGNLYENATSLDALHAGYLQARKSKRSSVACASFERRLGAQLTDLHETLRAGTYAPRPYATFTVYEPKARQITAPAFRDRVVQHAVYGVLRPLVDRRFIAQSFACRPGLGTHAAADYVQAALRQVEPSSYTLQMDIRKFYYRIDRDVLRAQYGRIIKDPRMLDLVLAFARMPQPTGIPIGNLLSQLSALLYLNDLDHFVKRDLCIQRYCRYVDDFVLIGLSQERAVECRDRIEKFLAQRLNLELSRATIAPVRRGVNFCGYRTWPRLRFVRRRALWQYRTAVKRGDAASAESSLGHARRTASLQYMLTYAKEQTHDLYSQLSAGVRRLHHAPTSRA
jgi:RNA-directed DNA polymerase